MSTTIALPDGNWSALIPADSLTVIVAHDGGCKMVWIPLSMIDDTPMLNSYLPQQVQRMWAEIQEES